MPSASSSSFKGYPTDELMFTCLIATLSGLMGALLFFPAFRLARLHFLCLKYSEGSKIKRFFYYLNFFLPFAVSVCWINTSRWTHPVHSKPAVEPNAANEFLSMVTPATPDSSSSTLSYSKQLQITILNLIFSSNLKIYLAISVFLLRLVLYRYYAQSYLNLAFEMAASMRKHSQVKHKTKSSFY